MWPVPKNFDRWNYWSLACRITGKTQGCLENSHQSTAVTFWRARGFEILREYSFPEIIVLDLTNFPQNGSSRLISWHFSTKNYSYYTSSLFSVNFFSDGYLDHTKNPCWNYQSIFFITPLFLLCIALIVWERVLHEKKNDSGKTRLLRFKMSLLCGSPSNLILGGNPNAIQGSQ